VGCFVVLVFATGLFAGLSVFALLVRAGRFAGNVPCCQPKTSGNRLMQTPSKPKTKLPIRRLAMGFRRIELSFLDKTKARTCAALAIYFHSNAKFWAA
jgi:hypothetical protein